ncbi:MAG: hypothetical protein ACAF41_15135 [Leptolyngbya sp. BL-A-14]
MQLFFHNVGLNGANRDFPKTVSNRIPITVAEQSIPLDAPYREEVVQQLQSRFPLGSFNCWGVPTGAESIMKNLNVGDAMLFVKTIGGEHGEIPALGIVKVFVKKQMRELSKVLWGDLGYPYIFFFDTENISLNWTSFKDAVGYKANYRPPGYVSRVANLKKIQAKFNGVQGYINFLRTGDIQLFNVDRSAQAPLIDEEIFNRSESNSSTLRIERSIEFPPEYWEAGTSILSYFNRVLGIKYPNKKIKVRIEQEGLMLRMIINTSTGEREEIEKTLNEYGMVVTGKMEPESFLDDPFEAMALRNKLEIADLELRQTRQLLEITTHSSQKRIETLEVQVDKLHSLIEKGLQSGNYIFGEISRMTEQNKATYNLNNAKFGGGFAAEGGFQVGGSFVDMSSANNLTDAAQKIQELLQQLQGKGVSIEDAQKEAASDLAEQAKANPTVMGKLVKWGQSLADTAGKTTVSEAAKGVVKLALQMSGIPLP